MQTHLIYFALALTCGLAGSAFAVEQDKPAQKSGLDFADEVAPLLRKYCNGCHNASDAEGKLALDTYQAILRGGGRGAAVVPGSSERSRLIRVLDGSSQPQMPPEGSEAPTEAEVALLRRWIDAGAAGPAGGELDPTRLITPHVLLETKNVRRPIAALAWSPDGSTLAVGRYGEVELYDAASQAPYRSLSGIRGSIQGLAFSPSGKQLAAAAGEPGLFGEAGIWNVADGKLAGSFVLPGDAFYDVTFDSSGKQLITCGYDQQIHVWDARHGKVTHTLKGHNGAVFALAVRPKSQILASASADRTVKLWDLATAERLDTFGESLKDIYTVAMHPQGTHVIAGGVDNRIRMWRLSESGQEGTNQLIFARFAHQGPIIALAWSPQGNLIASAAEDRTLKLWDADSLTEKQPLPRQDDWAAALTFSPNGKTLAVGRLDGTLAFYDAETGKVQTPPQPTLTAIEPRGFQTGSKTQAMLTGTNLLGIEQFIVADKQIKVRALNNEEIPKQTKRAKPGTQLWVEVEVPKQAALGEATLRVKTAGGESSTVSLYVDNLPQLTETEPNNLQTEATPIPLENSLWGSIGAAGDVDHYTFTAKKGQTVVVDLAAARLSSKLNAVAVLLDERGTLIETSNDFDGEADPLIAFAVPYNGKFTLRVTDLMATGGATHTYRLSLGTFPYVTGCFPAAVPVEKSTKVELTGFNIPRGSSVSVQAAKLGRLPLGVDRQKFRLREAVQVDVVPEPDVAEVEPNDLPAQATRLKVPATAAGRIFAASSNEKSGESDVDLFRFSAEKGETWILETVAASTGSPLDTKLEVLDREGQPIERMLLQATRDSYINFRPIDSQTIDVRVQNWEEMELNQFLYMQGEVCQLFRMPQGPDSGFNFYASEGKRRCYFDTSASAHALHESVYIVQPHPPGTSLLSTGLPVFTLYYENDDDGLRKLGRDSRVTFTAPATGEYLARVGDVRGLSGDRYAYRLKIRRPEPGFKVSITGGKNPTLRRSSGQQISFKAERLDGFEGEIHIQVANLPPGLAISQPIVIEANHLTADVAVVAAADAKEPSEAESAAIEITATATINGQQMTQPVGNLGRVRVSDGAKLVVTLEPSLITLAPGSTTTALLKIERHGFDERVRFDVNNLPHGVIVDDLGLNGLLIPEGTTERKIFLSARPWVPEQERPCHARSQAAGNDISPPVMLRVVRPGKMAGK